MRPLSVTVTAVLAASGVPAAVITVEKVPGFDGVRVAPDEDELAVGALEVSKKFIG